MFASGKHSPEPVSAFADLLTESGLSQAELARRMGVKPSSVTRWKTTEVPKYAVSYLQLLVKVRRLCREV
jgi:transcriptional regulator with XRE-family HTH domain